MQLDRTEIVIRQRSTLELFDLSLQVLKRHWWAIAVTSAVFGFPLLILDNLATAWMLNQNSLELAEHAGVAAYLRPFWHLVTLYVLQFPLISLPTTIYLGNRIFYQSMPIGQLLRRLWSIAGRWLLVLGVLRLGLVGLVLELLIDRQVNFDVAIEFWFFIFAVGVALFYRAMSPFAPEILGLELCPLRITSPGTISYRARSRTLHRYSNSQNLRRFLGAAFFGCLLYFMLDGAQTFVLGAITGYWSWNDAFDLLRMQLSLWCVGLFMAVFRFLSYLDNRIRLEGWEIELRLKAEAARLEAETNAVAEANQTGQSGAPSAVHSSIKSARWVKLAGVVVGTVAALGEVAPLAAAQLAPQPVSQPLPHLVAQSLSQSVAQSGLESGSQSAAQSAAQSAVQSAARSIVERAAQSLPISDWYDKQTERFRPPEVIPAEDIPLRTAGRVSTSPPPTPTDPQSPSEPWFADWPVGELAILMQRLVFIALGLGLIALLAWLTYYALRDYLPEKDQRKHGKVMNIDPTRIAELPFESTPTANDPLSAAQRAMQAENYDQAIAYLLGYLLLALDQARLIYLQRGKTNRMYLQEVVRYPNLAAIVNSAVVPFEASYFGKHSVTRVQFLNAWQQVDAFHVGLHTASAVTVSSAASNSAEPSAAASADSAEAGALAAGVSPGNASATDARGDGKSGKLTLGMLLAVSCLGSLGCGSTASEMHPYGAVTSPGANRSLNGLGLHRKLWEAQGAKCSTPISLSPKLEQVDVIVLVGESYEPPGIQVRQWLERWLANGEQRTLLYFGRDFSADMFYRRQTLGALSGAQRRRSEELLALRQAEELLARWQQLPELVFCDWFYIDTRRVRKDYRQFHSDGFFTAHPADVSVPDTLASDTLASDALASKDWTAPVQGGELPLGELQGGDLQGSDLPLGEWPVGVALQPPDSKVWSDKLVQRIQSLSPPNSGKVPSSEESSSSTRTAPDLKPLLRSIRWSADEFGSSASLLEALQDPLDSEVLLSAGDGQPLIFRLTGADAENARLGSGQIIVVANGFPLLNGSLVTPLAAEIGQRLVELCGPAERVALLTFDEGGLSISETEESGLDGAGLEMFTVWPLSTITMPAALLGIIACAALWPILGRPQPLARRRVSDLGLHIEAIGGLMSETHDRKYAAGAIAEYYRTVRGENPPGWLSEFIPEGLPQQQLGSPESSEAGAVERR